jgi:hypothetical protein
MKTFTCTLDRLGNVQNGWRLGVWRRRRFIPGVSKRNNWNAVA